MSFRAVIMQVILSLTTIVAGFTTVYAQTNVIRVLTYNIRWSERADIATLSRVISSVNPDLVALQEVDVCVKHPGKVAANNVQAISQFAQYTGMHAIFASAFNVKRYPFGYGGGEFGNAVLSKYSFDKTRKTTYAAKGTEYRVALEAYITLNNGRQLRFISTHLDHNNNVVRSAQIAQINTQFTQCDIPTILCGDFNECLHDANGSIAAMDRYWTRGCDESQNTFIAWNPTVKIDYVFYRPQQCWRVVSREVVDQQSASDHRPLLVVLEMLN